MIRVSISLITAAFLIAAVLIAGMVSHVSPSPNLEIRTWYDLDAVRHNLAGNYTLMNPLDSTTAGYEELASGTANQGKGWQPIGTWEHPFSGSFDGRAWEIRDLFINRPEENLIGLFGIVGEGGVIENVGVVNAYVTGEGGVGGTVWRNWDGTVSNSYSTASVSSDSGIGGLVGYSRGTVSNSYFTGSVTGDECVGGLVGQNCGPVSNCFAAGSVIGESCVGGLVGDNFDTVSNCCYAAGSVIGEGAVGGLVGQNVYGTVSNSYSRGSVSGNSKVGGLVGTNLGTVSDSYSSGNVTGYSRVGGLVGWNIGTVSNSYSTGNVTGEDAVGGLVGDNVYGTVSNSFWDTETSGQATSGGGTGKTTLEMQDIATFSGAAWEIHAAPAGATNPAYTWNIVDDVTYPFLSWQPVSTSQNQQPIEITSVLGPVEPFTPAGPAVEITLKNVGVEPVISLTATLEPDTPFDTSFDFTFDVTPSNPLQPNRSTSATLTLIGGGFSSNNSYPLTINATLQNGAKFVYTKLVQIVEP